MTDTLQPAAGTRTIHVPEGLVGFPATEYEVAPVADGLFDLQLHPNIEVDTAANNIAQCVVKAGAKLFGLQIITRDLDTVFREAYSHGD